MYYIFVSVVAFMSGVLLVYLSRTEKKKSPEHEYEKIDAAGHVASCGGCGALFSSGEWRKQELVGYMDLHSDGDQLVELRNCLCRTPGRRYTRSAIIFR